MKELFFTTGQGLTSSEASHVANVAHEIVEGSLRRLSMMTTVTIIVTVEGTQITKSTANFVGSEFVRMAEAAPKLYQLSAWLREAVKAKEALLRGTENSELPAIRVEEFSKAQPLRPVEQREVDDAWAIEQLDVKARARYLALEAEAAAIGKLLHNNGTLARLRAEAAMPGLEWVRAPDNKTYPAEASIDQAMQIAVDEIFFDLQKKYRDVSKRLNAIKHQLHEATTVENVARRRANRQAWQSYESDMKTWEAERLEVQIRNQAAIQQWRQEQVEERARIAALKILIPDALQSILDEVRSHAS